MAKKQVKKKVGRKNKYVTHVEPHLEEIVTWKWQGMHEETICKKLGVSVSSFNLYKTQYSELTEVIKRGDKKIAEVAERSLFDSIRGHYVEETKTVIELDADGNEKTRTETTKRWVEPHMTGIIFTLKNKDPGNWDDTRHTIISGEIETKNPLVNLSDEELKKLIKLGDNNESTSN